MSHWVNAGPSTLSLTLTFKQALIQQLADAISRVLHVPSLVPLRYQ